MKRYLILIGLLLPLPAQSPPVEASYLIKAAKLEVPWNIFVRKLFGCPVTGPIIDPPKECNVNRGQFSYSDYIRVRKEAKDFFEFKD